MSKHLPSDMVENSPSKRQKRAHHPPRPDLKAAVFANGDGARLTASTTNPPKSLKLTRTNESRTAILKRDDLGDVDKPQKSSSAVIEISSDSSSIAESSGEDDEELEEEPAVNGTGRKVNGHNESVEDSGLEPESEESGEETKGRKNADADEDAEHEELSFGELVKARDPDPIDVEAAFADDDDDDAAAVVRRPNTSLSAPSANSLGTVLTQALRTNDAELMECCFLVHDLDSVRATIERLPSNLVATLLHKLAERMQKRPGRAGRLMVWVQWALVSHGGYLAGQTGLMKRVGSLYRVINERATSLQPLLQLKGKLDMLNAQMELRKNMQRAADASKAEEDNPVIYVEGQEESSDEDDDSDMEDLDGPGQRLRSGKTKRLEMSLNNEDSGDEDGMPLINGLSQDDELSDDNDDADENLIGEEEEEDDEDQDTSGEEEFDEESEDVDVSDSEEEPAGPPKRSVTASTRFARR